MPTIQIKLDDQTAQAATKLAQKLGLPLTTWVRTLIAAEIERQKPAEPVTRVTAKPWKPARPTMPPNDEIARQATILDEHIENWCDCLRQGYTFKEAYRSKFGHDYEGD